MATAALGAALAILLAGCAGAPPTLTPHPPTAEAPAPTAAPAPPTEAPAGAPGDAGTPDGSGQKAALEYADLLALGEGLTAALESGDVEEWMALTALSGEEAQQQRDWFAGVQAVPMELREMHPTRVSEREVAGDVNGPKVEFGFRHQITGVDPVPSVVLYELVLEREGVDGPYRVVGVGGSHQVDSGYPQLWDVRTVDVHETDHLVLVVEEGIEGQEDWGWGTVSVEELVPSLDEAAGILLDRFPVEGVDRIAVSAVAPELLAELYGDAEEGAYAGFAEALSASPEVTPGRDLPELVDDDLLTGRVVLDLDYSGNELLLYHGIEGGLPLMRHEALHLVMLLRHPGGNPPMWVGEGFAGWVELTGDAEVLADHELWYTHFVEDTGLPETLPPSLPWDFAEDEEAHYLESANVFLYAEAAFGAEATLELGDALHANNIWIGGDTGLDEVLQDRVGVGLAEFEAGYVDWVAESYP